MRRKPGKILPDRQVHFTPYPRQSEAKLEAFDEYLPDFYWGTWRHRVFRTLGLSTISGVQHVSGWPWWVPAVFARRSVAKAALKCNVGGSSAYLVELAVDYDPDDSDTVLYLEHLKRIWERLAEKGRPMPDDVRVHLEDEYPGLAAKYFGPVDFETMARVHAREAAEEAEEVATPRKT